MREFNCQLEELINKAHNFIGRFVHIYLNDISIYLRSIEEHKEHLYKIFITPRNNHLFLSVFTIILYSERMNCLSYIINNKGIYAKIEKIQKHTGLEIAL